MKSAASWLLTGLLLWLTLNHHAWCFVSKSWTFQRKQQHPQPAAGSLLLQSTGRTATALSCFEEENFFLHQVETTVQKVLSNVTDCDNILDLPGQQREAVGVARHLKRRLQNLRRNNDCPRCWMQRAHCICPNCPPLSPAVLDDSGDHGSIRRIFLLMHHKEIGLKVDTAKLILAAFPERCRLVVAGIGPEYQDSMRELHDAMRQTHHTSSTSSSCLVLFPNDNAVTFADLISLQKQQHNNNKDDDDTPSSQAFDVVVLDGTWAQARKMEARYLPDPSEGGPRRVQLSQDAVAALQGGSALSGGHQLRRHDIAWRQVGTFEATRVFLKDVVMATSNQCDKSRNERIQKLDQAKTYQEMANKAAMIELGPPRTKTKRCE